MSLGIFMQIIMQGRLLSTKVRSEYGGYGSAQCIFFSFGGASLLSYMENKFNCSFVYKAQLIIFYLKGGTTSLHIQHLALGVRYFQNEDVNAARRVSI